MSIRTQLVLDLQKHLVGPRAGRDEVLSDPHKEYVAGVLAPLSDEEPIPDIDDDAELPDGDTETDSEDSDDDAGIAFSSGLAPALDPKSYPRSLGVSFVVRTESAPPRLNICVTFARYEPEDDAGTIHRRHAYGRVYADVQVQDGWRAPAPADVAVQMRCVAMGTDIYRVSVFLCNTRRVSGPYALSEDYVLQPQIRVVLGANCALDSVIRSSTDAGGGDEKSLELLYRERSARARGHLCAAVWDEIDPEFPLPDGSESPFSWVDGEAITELDRLAFARSHVRTEYLPLYPVVAPSALWRDHFGSSCELRAGHLAETYDPETLASLLNPLPAAYRTWIEQQDTSPLSDDLKPVGQLHLTRCSDACQRIERAIRLLQTDGDVRLAFCFANKAIHEQNRWRSVREERQGRTGREFSWYPFQLAFILLALEGIANPTSADRKLCDLLWFPTGGGKTEAYLGLVAFTLALRRLRGPHDSEGHGVETGLGVLSRYTLRLLTIQQFRRALGVITACEALRIQPVAGGSIGWRPESCDRPHDYIWGGTRFSAGLWAGQGVTPNHLHATGYPPNPGAIEILSDGALRSDTEPAQVLNCPCCDTYLALAQPRHMGQEKQAFPAGTELHLHLVVYSDREPPTLDPVHLSGADIRVEGCQVYAHPVPDYYTISVRLRAIGNGFSAHEVDGWWRTTLHPALGGQVHVTLSCARASRPGYFFRYFTARQARREEKYEIEIYCPNPECGLTVGEWREKSPIPSHLGEVPRDRQTWQEVIEPFRAGTDPTRGARVPIPARTVDEQIYRHPPSLLVATVDKFARLAFAPEAAALFGNVTHYEKQLTIAERRYGYCREEKRPALTRRLDWQIRPPDLVLQDELHLIDGPLGSMVGLYETAIDALSEERNTAITRPKYIASTATVRQAGEQVQALFARELFQFPPPGLSVDDSFFAHTREVHPATETRTPGRLYVGVAAPGKGAQTPIVRIWSVLLQAVESARRAGATDQELDAFWTLVGYFNAIRELAGAASLYRQDIPQRIEHMARTGGGIARDTSREAVELSSRVDSLLLPSLLDRLGKDLSSNDAETAALATSMFGTGVDVARLGLMVVHGQPKSTSSYIQASGRVGRSGGGLVVSFLRASRPRDLDHYEFFTGYHRQLYRSVEPVTVAPFSPRARDRGIGPLCALLLRQSAQILGHQVPDFWSSERGAPAMEQHRGNDEVRALCEILEQRARQQPDGRIPEQNTTYQEVESELDRWRNLAALHQNNLRYYEYAARTIPRHPVVLGDPQHQRNNLDVAFENAPQSLREVEATTGFKV